MPMSEEKAYAYPLASIMAEVEYRHRIFCSSEDMEKQLQEMAHWLTTPSSHFGNNGNIRFCGGAISQRIGCVIYGYIGGIHTT